MGKCKSLKDFDMYGSSVGFSYKGRQTYNTSTGGFLSILTNVFMLFFVLDRTTKFITRGRTTHSYRVALDEISSETVFTKDDFKP